MKTTKGNFLLRIAEWVASGGVGNFLIPIPIALVGVIAAYQALQGKGWLASILVLLPVFIAEFLFYRHWRAKRREWFSGKRAELSRRLGAYTWLDNARTPEQYLIAAIANISDIHWCFHGVWPLAPSTWQELPPTPEVIAPLLERAYEESDPQVKLESFEKYLLGWMIVLTSVAHKEEIGEGETAFELFLKTFEEFKRTGVVPQ